MSSYGRCSGLLNSCPSQYTPSAGRQCSLDHLTSVQYRVFYQLPTGLSLCVLLHPHTSLGIDIDFWDRASCYVVSMQCLFFSREEL